MSTDKPDDPQYDVVDGEIVSEEPVSSPPGKTPPASSGNFAAKAGWSLAILLAVFTGGIFAQPWVSDRLVALGLLEETTSGEDQATARELEALKTRLAAQERLIDSLGSRVDGQQTEIENTRAKADQTDNDLALLAAAGRDGGAVSNGADPDLVAALQQEVTSLRSALDAIQSNPGTAVPAETPGENPEVEAIKGRLELERTETGQLKARLAAIEEALASAASGDLSSSPRGRLALSLSDLHRRVEAGEAFRSALSAARLDLTMLPALDQQKAGAALTVLERHEDGVASHLDLVNAFPGLVRAIKIAAAEGTSESWMASLFVTRDKSSEAGPVDAALNEAESLLAARHLAGALAKIQSINVAAGEEIASWKARALARHEALEASNRLFALATGASADLAEAEADEALPGTVE